jgi:sugar phosphate isomerase/epimerase
MVHASDNRGQFDDHLAPGDGQIDWGRFLRHLDEVQFSGAIILEIADLGDSSSTLRAAQRGRWRLRHADAVAASSASCGEGG